MKAIITFFSALVALSITSHETKANDSGPIEIVYCGQAFVESYQHGKLVNAKWYDEQHWVFGKDGLEQLITIIDNAKRILTGYSAYDQTLRQTHLVVKFHIVQKSIYFDGTIEEEVIYQP